jgi:hypothetical protein
MLHSQVVKALEIIDPKDHDFYYIEGVNRRYNINHKGLVWDNETKAFKYPEIVNNVAYTTYIEDDKVVKAPTHRLWLKAFSPMHVSNEKYDKNLQAIKLDFDKTSIKIDPLSFNHHNLIWLIPKGGIESDIPGYYSIPRYPEVVVSRAGKFLYHKTKKDCPITFTKFNKKQIVTLDFVSENNTYNAGVSVMKLMALAFHPYPIEFELAKIAKLNEKSDSYTAENVQWVKATRAEPPIPVGNVYLDRNTTLTLYEPIEAFNKAIVPIVPIDNPDFVTYHKVGNLLIPTPGINKYSSKNSKVQDVTPISFKAKNTL